MKLAHAIKVGERFADSPRVTAEERIALVVLVSFAKRIFKSREAIRSLASAVTGDEDLNQTEMFGGGDGGGS